MGFEKGNSVSKGRPKGSTNKSTEKIKNAFQALLHRSLPNLEKDLMSLEPKDRIDKIIALSKFVLPTLKAVDATIENTGMPQTLGFQINYLQNKEDEDIDTQQVLDITPEQE
tara:strand:- start:105 stop:440 length:336 start_codon:yes stop_codon:yes gene_type:complete